MKRPFWRDAPLMAGMLLAGAISEAPDLLAWAVVHHPTALVWAAKAAGVVSAAVTYWNRAKTDPLGGLRQEAEQASAMLQTTTKKDGE